jgi:hypothetical protein
MVTGMAGVKTSGVKTYNNANFKTVLTNKIEPGSAQVGPGYHHAMLHASGNFPGPLTRTRKPIPTGKFRGNFFFKKISRNFLPITTQPLTTQQPTSTLNFPTTGGLLTVNPTLNRAHKSIHRLNKFQPKSCLAPSSFN